MFDSFISSIKTLQSYGHLDVKLSLPYSCAIFQKETTTKHVYIEGTIDT